MEKRDLGFSTAEQVSTNLHQEHYGPRTTFGIPPFVTFSAARSARNRARLSFGSTTTLRIVPELRYSTLPVPLPDILSREDIPKIIRYLFCDRVCDRFFDDSFSLVKSGSAPTRGVYLSDRLRVVCYAFCLEEMFGKPLYGSVEYLSSGTIRSVVVEPKDRRALFLALRAAEKVTKGGIPKVVRGP